MMTDILPGVPGGFVPGFGDGSTSKGKIKIITVFNFVFMLKHVTGATLGIIFLKIFQEYNYAEIRVVYFIL